VTNLKFILYCIENMSYLKINFHKGEVIVLGASKEESTRLANCLNCKEGELPMKYLGIPVTSAKLYTTDLMMLSEGRKKITSLAKFVGVIWWKINYVRE
jgi:hypothetical protein